MQKFKRSYPEFQNFFTFDSFNRVQEQCLGRILSQENNMIVSAPTSSGKTVIFELCIIRQIYQSAKQGKSLKCLYLAPIKSLCHEKATQWKQSFGNYKKMNGNPLRVYQLTGDNIQMDGQSENFNNSNIIIATPEKIDYFSRQYLQSLMKVNLLLVDEIHMLNFQERGATLEAVISRIMSLSQRFNLTNEKNENFVSSKSDKQNQLKKTKTRIIAVSATIPNINDIGEWLKVPKQLMMVFGQEYRPVKLKKVALGFYSTNNPFTFEKTLNFKLIQNIRQYSQNKGTLVFCQTQKGTQSACQQLIKDMNQRQFIQDNQHLQSLAQSSKMFNNNTLKLMVTQGVGFHNASLSLQDRTLVEKLFRQEKIRVLCTTSTLSMGINLPARLVIIKSTKVYRGAGKGYQQYTMIEIDQMAGRAGRVPFDKQGTVLIMTQKNNLKKYENYANSSRNNQIQKQTLESQLASHLIQHLNAQISLKSIRSQNDVYNYFYNSFCYIRMKKVPSFYGVRVSPHFNNLQAIKNYIETSCKQAIQKLKMYKIIDYNQQNKRINPYQLSMIISKNNIQIQTIITMINESVSNPLKTLKSFLMMLSKAEQIKKIRSKNDQRNCLKGLNQKNLFQIKQAISTSQRKAFVLIQAQLSGKSIQNWQMRKQAKDITYFFRRLNYCISKIGAEKKLFWVSIWSAKFSKFFYQGFWEHNEAQIMKQISGLKQKHKMLTSKGINNIQKVIENLGNIDTICQKSNSFSQQIIQEISNLKEKTLVYLEKNSEYMNCSIKFQGNFNDKMKYIRVLVSDDKFNLYTTRFINETTKQITVSIPLNHTYFWGQKCYIAIIKDGYIGFDQFYTFNKIGNLTYCDMKLVYEKFDQKQKQNGNKGKVKQRRKTVQPYKEKKDIDSSVVKNQINKEVQQQKSKKLNLKLIQQNQSKHKSLNEKYKNLKMIGQPKKQKNMRDDKNLIDQIEVDISIPFNKNNVKKSMIFKEITQKENHLEDTTKKSPTFQKDGQTFIKQNKRKLGKLQQFKKRSNRYQNDQMDYEQTQNFFGRDKKLKINSSASRDFETKQISPQHMSSNRYSIFENNVSSNQNCKKQKQQRGFNNYKNWNQIPFDQSSNKKLQDFGWEKRFNEKQVANKKFLRITDNQDNLQYQKDPIFKEKIKKQKMNYFEEKKQLKHQGLIENNIKKQKISKQKKQKIEPQNAYEYFSGLF